MKPVLLLSTAALLALSATTVSAAKTHPAAVHHGFAKAHALPHGNKHFVTLYDQNGNDAGVSVVSDDFDSAFDSYDSQGADDFTVPSLHQWIIKEVDVTGAYFNGSGPASGVTVYFYRDNGGLPGDLVEEVDGSQFTDTAGSFAINLDDAIALKAGTYWVSVQAQMDFSGGAGEWGWEVNSVQNGNPSAWQNPGDGFATGCTSWGTTESCLGEGPDLMFALKGMDHLKKKDVGGGGD
jgi:hypothetical protein